MSLNIKEFIKHIPALKNDVSRYNLLTSDEQKDPVIAVFGKFNHGKSTLLNALISKQDYFAASDKRETVVNQEFHDSANSITWLDTPGLDADVTQKDDTEANSGISIKADLVLFVHNIQAGELDRAELEYFNKLSSNFKDERRILVLTQIDQVSEELKNQAIKKIKTQLSNFKIFEVSAKRYLKGIEEQKDKFIELSGIIELLAEINRTKKTIILSRNTEIDNLKNNIISKIKTEIEITNKEMDILNQSIVSEETKLKHACNTLFNKIN